MNTNNIPTTSNTNLNISNPDVLVPMPFNPDPTTYPGKFISKTWDIQQKEGKPIVKDLVIKVALEKKDELGQQIEVERRYSMLPRARGISDFKKDMASYLGYKLDKDNNIDEFPARFLANQSLIKLENEAVEVSYKIKKGKNASFDTFLPAKTTPAQTPPTETAEPASVPATPTEATETTPAVPAVTA